MSRRTYHDWYLIRGGSDLLRRVIPTRPRIRFPALRQFQVERLEERCLLSADPIYQAAAWPHAAPLQADDLLVKNGNSTVGSANAAIAFSAPPDLQQLSLAHNTAAVEIPPLDLANTFLLHSNPGASKVIYLDFDGHITRDTLWNIREEAPIPNIVTPAYSTDGDSEFSDIELENIQTIWQMVSEDFIPFNVDVTTEDPGLEALRNSGSGDNQWGIRVAIGGSTNDWYTVPPDGAEVGGVAYLTSFSWDSDTACFVFAGDGIPGDVKFTAEASSHEVGHTLGLGHDGQVVLDPDVDPVEYYPGHGSGATGWAPIMGVGYEKELVQWSKGEYPNANNIQDDLEIITSFNGFDYRFDDHGNLRTTASPLAATSTEFFSEGIIERNTDVDYFAFTIGSEGEAVTLDIDPYYRSPNLDILATLYNSSGDTIDTSNPVDDLNASFNLILQAGTYYLSVDGTGRPAPGADDFGYSDYGSLGQYSINGTRKELLVGVDFDVDGGSGPLNWTLYSGGSGPAALTDLINEAGYTTPFNLSISTSGTSINSFSNTINSGTIPTHNQPLDDLDGYISNTGETWTFAWSDLLPMTVYEVFVFGLTDLAGGNDVVISGDGNPVSFAQTLVSDDLVVNDELGSSTRDLGTFSERITSTGSGTIAITVSNTAGASAAALAGLAIRSAKPGAIEGQKWNDLNGDGLKDSDEPGLPGWTIFIDENDNGELDSASQHVFASADVPQVVEDYTIVKSQLFFTGPTAVFDVDVTLDITHTYDADIEAFLISPSGTRVELFTDVGGFENNFHDTTLDDEAATSITNGVAPFTGQFRPEGSLSNFDGEDPNGIWTLEITDDAASDTGSLNSWSLTITVSERSTVTDSKGRYRFVELPPGEYKMVEVQQAGWIQTFAPPPVTVYPGERARNVDFGNMEIGPEATLGSIHGQKWNDLNGDGVKDDAEPRLADWTIYLDRNDNGVLDSNFPQTLDSEDVPKFIDNFSSVTSRLVVDGLSTVFDVDVRLNITHTFDADLNAYLISPAGTRVELFTHVGGGNNDFDNTTLDDEAATPITNGSAPFAGSFRPDGLLSDMDGEDANGVWTLQIVDTASADVGFLNSWSLTITSAEQSTTTDANGNYSFLDLAPNSYVVREVQQPGWVQTLAPPLVIVDEGDDVMDADFGNMALQPLPGDFDRNGSVDAGDYVVWRSSMGSNVLAFQGADGSGNGVVDQDDYGVWRAHFGEVLPPPSAGTSVNSVAAVLLASPLPDGKKAVTEPVAPVQIGEVEGGRENAELVAIRSSLLDLAAPVSPRIVGPQLVGAVREASHVESSSDAALMAWLATVADDDGGGGGGRDFDAGPRSSDPFDEVIRDERFEALNLAFETLASSAI